VRADMRLISFADDLDFGPKKGVDALVDYYPNAFIERLHVAPRDWGLQRIGHFGFFKRDMPAKHWAAQADWLLQAALATPQQDRAVTRPLQPRRSPEPGRRAGPSR
jgi:hypothetical protein